MPHGIVSDTVQETETLVSEIVISMDPHCVISDRIKCAKSLGIMIDTELEIQRLIMLIKAKLSRLYNIYNYFFYCKFSNHLVTPI